MSAKTGFWSAFGALVGGAVGAAAGYGVSTYMPVGYAAESRRFPRRRRGSQETEDAMVIGSAVGATLGAFIGGAASSDEPQIVQLAQGPQGSR